MMVTFILNAGTIVPFINLLYKIKLQRQKQHTRDALNRPAPIFDTLNRNKAGTPLGGGLLIIVNTIVMFLASFPMLYYFWVPITSIYGDSGTEIKVLMFTFISFGILGLYDDIRKVFFIESNAIIGLSIKHKLLLETILAGVIGYWLYADLKIQILHVPLIGVFDIGIFYILFAVFVIIAFANAFNITDGLDGLATGVLMIALAAFWVISRSILDTTLSVFIAVWIGGLIAFLYFNVYPARIFLGDTGALSFGATFAVIGLLLGKTFSLPIIGGIFVAEIASSLLQIVSKKYRGKKMFTVAPIHLWLGKRGWHESTIVFRFWLASIMLAVVGLTLAFLT